MPVSPAVFPGQVEFESVARACSTCYMICSRYYILPDSLNLDTLLVDLDQPKIRPKRPERVGAAGDVATLDD